MHDQLRPVLTLSDGLPYFKDNFFEKRWYKFGLRAGLILVVLIAAYIPALIGNVLWIDETETTHEHLLRSAGGLEQLWRHPSIQPAYQPLAETVLWLQYQLWGNNLDGTSAAGSTNNAIGFHVVSIALHMANCMLVWFALRRLNVPGAWLAAAIFALHPIQVQAVAWVGGQPMLFATFCYALSLMLYLRFAQIEPAEDLDPSIKLSEEWYQSHPEAPALPVTLGSMPRTCYAFSLAMFLCAVLSDLGSWTLPVILLMILWWRGGHVTRRDIKSLLPYMVIGGVALIFSFVQPELYASRNGIGLNLSIMGRLLLPGRALFYYILKLILPFPMSFSGPQWAVSGWVWWQYLFLIGLIAGLTLLWRRRDSIGKGPLVGIAFFLLNLVPVAGLTRFGWTRYSFVGNYLQYRAGIGLIALLVAGLMIWIARARSKDAVHLYRLVSGTVLLAAFTALLFMQSLNYVSASTLWSADLGVDPHSEIAHRQAAWTYIKEAKPEEAVDEIKKAIKDNPNSAGLWVELGKSYEAAHQSHAAVQSYQKAIEIDPRNTAALSGLARQGKIADAIAAYLHVFQLDPDDASAHSAIADLYARQNQFDQALRHLREAVRIEPNSTLFHLNLARLLFAEGQRRNQEKLSREATDLFHEASEQLQTSSKLDPNNYDTFMTAGEMLSKLQDFGRAERMYRDATRIRPKSFEAWNNLGVSVAAQGRLGEAISFFYQALKINPNFAAALKNLEAAKRGETKSN